MKKNKTYATMLTNLTQFVVKALFDYDVENGWLIRKKDKYGRPYNKPCGHKPTRKGYGRISINGTMYSTHRLIWLWYYGTWPQFEIDHIDQNKMNNRIENLRDVEHKQNQQNHGIQRNNTSGFLGVHLCKRDGKYMAMIRNNGERIYLGSFNIPEEAFLAYQLAKIKYHPESPDAKQYFRELTYAS